MAVLLIDVAHVYATGFRVYFDPAELRKRPWLYGLTPLLALAIGAAIYSESSVWFWRLLAYLAVFHFVRQQYGWVALYRSRGKEQGRLGKWIDSLAIYMATIYPLVYWHAHLPRNFWWFLQGDFAANSGNRRLRAGTDLLVVATRLRGTLGLPRMGIGSMESGQGHRGGNDGDLLVHRNHHVQFRLRVHGHQRDHPRRALHGSGLLVPPCHRRPVTGEPVTCEPVAGEPVAGEPRRGSEEVPPVHGDNASGPVGASAESWRRVVMFLATIWVLAYLEELLWDWGVWHERGWLFGSFTALGSAESVAGPPVGGPADHALHPGRFYLEATIGDGGCFDPCCRDSAESKLHHSVLDAQTNVASMQHGSTCRTLKAEILFECLRFNLTPRRSNTGFCWMRRDAPRTGSIGDQFKLSTGGDSERVFRQRQTDREIGTQSHGSL